MSVEGRSPTDQNAAGAPKSSQHWSRFSERGSLLGLRVVFACYRLLGERGACLLLYPIIGYFFVANRAARAASRKFLQKVAFHSGRPAPRSGDVFRHLYAFGSAALDKLAAWTGGVDAARLVFPHQAELEHLAASKQGALLIGSHLGNLEMMRALATHHHAAKVNAVLYTKHAQRFNELLQQVNPDFGINFIQISHLGPDSAILLKDKIDQGELVVIVGDRTPPVESGSRRVRLIDFLGEPAPFAEGPFILASLLECPVYLFYCLREGKNFQIYLDHFADRIDLPRRSRQEKLGDYMQQYARNLESFCLKAPEQWFNFYDFWRHETADTPEKN